MFFINFFHVKITFIKVEKREDFINFVDKTQTVDVYFSNLLTRETNLKKI